MKIKIAVASNINFCNHTLPILLESLLDCDIPKEDIFIHIAGCNIYEEKTIDDLKYFYLDHNSFEYSPLINICEQKLESDYWFLIQDTCKVGKDFKKLLYNIPSHMPEKVALRSWPSMSMGSYKYTYLLSVANKLFNIKNKNYSEESLNYWKSWGVPNEDYILWKTQPQPVIYNNIDSCEVKDYNNWYNTNTIRRTEYYASLDLYKNKSNWGQSHIFGRNI